MASRDESYSVRNFISLVRSASSVRLRLVISREMPKVPMISPSGLRRGTLLVETHAMRPSG